MGADQVAAIRPLLSEAIDGPPSTCVTFEVDGDTSKWVQFIDWTVNAAYPFTTAPQFDREVLECNTAKAHVTQWEPGKFVTFDISHSASSDVAEWIDRYFVRILRCSDDYYDVNTSFDEM